ncbi:glycerophosphodiester phosphodiesterase [Anatilimnocola sp. NA78]|uniref:glycerophosphodiester phosphodiesterase n=1 Tax=Anatilimnocola sp. NA78 TaxID=3415683 RepID=UPI003CE4AA6D
MIDWLRNGLCLAMVVAMAPLTHAAEPTATQPIAHRGLLKHSPENTLANFATCRLLRLGFEFDVRRSKDGTLICLHDDTLDRTTNGKGQASERTVAELFQLDAGAWFDLAFRGERIPTLEQVCKLIATAPSETAFYTADLKGDDDKLEADIVALAKEQRALSKVLFIGRAIDHPEVRSRLRKADPTCHVAALAQTAADVQKAIVDQDSDWVYLRFVPERDLVTKINAAGKRTIIAGTTVSGEEPENWSRCAAAGVDLVLTDYPLEFRTKSKAARHNK